MASKSVKGPQQYVASMDFDEGGGCFMVMSRKKRTDGRAKRFWMFQARRGEPEDRIKMPRWFTDALKRNDVLIVVEGGKSGKTWREFSAWCNESSKGRLA